MKSKNSYDIEFEKLVLISITSEYIDKYITRVLYRMLRLIEKLWVQDIVNGYSRCYQE